MNRPKREGATPDYIGVCTRPRCYFRSAAMEKLRSAQAERAVAALARAVNMPDLRRQAIRRAIAAIYAARVSEQMARESGHFIP